MSLHLLPKKSWHVWLPENLDKVRQDEARHAAEIDKQRSLNVASDQNALFDALRRRAAGEAPTSKPEEFALVSGSRHAEQASGTMPPKPQLQKGRPAAAPADGIALVDDATRTGPWYLHSRGRGPWDPHHGGVAHAGPVEGHAASAGRDVAGGEHRHAAMSSAAALARDDPLSLVKRTLAKAGPTTTPSQSHVRPMGERQQPQHSLHSIDAGADKQSGQPQESHRHSTHRHRDRHRHRGRGEERSRSTDRSTWTSTSSSTSRSRSPRRSRRRSSRSRSRSRDRHRSRDRSKGERKQHERGSTRGDDQRSHRRRRSRSKSG